MKDGGSFSLPNAEVAIIDRHLILCICLSSFGISKLDDASVPSKSYY
jgi:hypothetical protein